MMGFIAMKKVCLWFLLSDFEVAMGLDPLKSVPFLVPPAAAFH
jgi:hypothetical protein